MTLPQTTPIGTSLVHLLGAPVFHPAKATLAMTPQSTTELPCLLLPHHSKRILLQGPGGSGRTSMLMNLAYTSAAGATSTCHCLVQPCRCTPVVIYRKSQSMQKEDDFPIPCLCTNDSSTSTKGIDENSTKDWDLDILQRIRIRYVASAREILQDLLGMLGQPLHEQPFKAILIDDLDLICGDEKNENIIRPSSGTESSISIMQTRKKMIDGITTDSEEIGKILSQISLLYCAYTSCSSCRHKSCTTTSIWQRIHRCGQRIFDCKSRGSVDGNCRVFKTVLPFHCSWNRCPKASAFSLPRKAQ